MNMSADGDHGSHEHPGSSGPGDLAIRPVSLENHPVFLRNYTCPTVQLEGLAACVTQWTNAGIQRAVIVAPPGFGKTVGIRYVSDQLAFHFPDVVCLRMRCASTEISEDGLGPVIQLRIGHEPSAPIVLCANLRSQEPLQELATRMGKRTILLWIDESHLLHPVQDDVLRRLQDELEEAEIRLITLLVGQPGVRKLNEKRVSRAIDTPRIIPAVRAEEFELHGLRSATEIEYCLRAFDYICFPSNSDWSYTRFFLPHAYLHGLRLAAHADVLWQIFLEEDLDGKALAATEVPIACFARTLERVLIEGARQDSSNFSINEEFWRSAVLKSGWVAWRGCHSSLPEASGVDAPY